MCCWESPDTTHRERLSGCELWLNSPSDFGASYTSNDCRATKLVNLRIFDDPETGKPWDKSVAEVGLEMLCVSQVSL